MEIQRIRCVGGSRLDLRKFRVLGTIGRKKDVKNGVDCHSVNLTFNGRRASSMMQKGSSPRTGGFDSRQCKAQNHAYLALTEVHL